MLGDVALELHGKQGVLMARTPGDRSLECEISSSETLRNMYELFDELGHAKRYSEELGELEICIHGEWLLFFVAEKALKDEQEYERWAKDAELVAEGYWRQ